MLMDIVSLGVRSYLDARQTLGDALVHAIPDTYLASINMISSGEPNQIIGGLLIALGLSYLIIRGLWKLIFSWFGRWTIDRIR